MSVTACRILLYLQDSWTHFFWQEESLTEKKKPALFSGFNVGETPEV